MDEFAQILRAWRAGSARKMTAVPGSEDEQKLDLLRVIGLQELHGRPA